ncbi:MAG TPA: sulfite exporter TauE/SafE family protein [Acidimicrobiales bacterium]|nr:sulfite exporter TauE/SafE family protein [Acidimicrobiales bacterium]
MRRLLTFALAGVLAQLVDGALGMAYGVTATSFLLSGGTAPAVASATVHLAEVGTTFVSGISHWRFGNVSWRLVALLGVPGAVGGYVGASVLTSIDGATAKPWIAGILLTLGLLVLARFAFGRTPTPAPESRLRARSMTPLGIGAGFIDAIGGGGWGPVTTPTLLTFGRVEPRKAIGSVSASEFLVSLAASIGFLRGLGSEAIDAGIVAALLIGGIAIAPLAAYLVKVLPVRVMGTLVGSLVIVTNSRTLMTANHVAGPTRLVVLVVVSAGAAALLVKASRAHQAELRENPPAVVAPVTA